MEIYSKVPVKDEFVLKLFYLNPGAMEPTHLIHKDPEQVFELTARGNLVGVVSDGSAVLGLGNIGENWNRSFSIDRKNRPIVQENSSNCHETG